MYRTYSMWSVSERGEYEDASRHIVGARNAQRRGFRESSSQFEQVRSKERAWDGQHRQDWNPLRDESS